MPAVPCHAFTNLERFQLHLVEVHHLAPLAETAFHEQARQRFLGLVRRGEVNVPEVAAWFENVDSVEKTVGVLVDFSDHAGPRVFPLIVLEVPPQMQFLAALQLFSETQNAPVAADEK